MSMHQKILTNSGVQGWSTETPYNSYMIFCVGNNIAHESAFRAWAADNQIGFKNLHGAYKGEQERSFIVNCQHYDKCRPWFKNEESFLYLSPLYRNKRMYGRRKALLFYLDGRIEPVGVWRDVPKEYALKQQAWTYDIDADTYWIAEEI